MQKYVNIIARKNNIAGQFNVSKSGVNGDRVFVSENYVIKFFSGRKKQYYPNEMFIYNSLNLKYRSELIDAGKIEDNYYIVMTKSKGYTLYSIWGSLTCKERELCIEKIAEILNAISNLTKPKVLDFHAIITQRYFDIINGIDLSQKVLDRVNMFFYNNIDYISDNEICYYNYIDVHFDNFIYYDGDIKVIDFEALEISPLDYQMDRWCRMCRHPKIYANKEDKIKINEIDYLNLIDLMKKYYPKAFSHPNSRERLHLYSLIYNLKVIKKHTLQEHDMLFFLNEDMNL